MWAMTRRDPDGSRVMETTEGERRLFWDALDNDKEDDVTVDGGGGIEKEDDTRTLR